MMNFKNIGGLKSPRLKLGKHIKRIRNHKLNVAKAKYKAQKAKEYMRSQNIDFY